MTKIKISVIIPVYNVQGYLSDCLESVINQTLKDIEIIIINDGSTDDSLNICKEYARRDSRIVIINKKNEGVYAARNDGIRAARGTYVFFLDSDDLLSDFKVLELLYDLAISNNVLIAGGKLERLYPDGHIVKDEDIITHNGVSYIASGVTEYRDYQYDYGYTCYIYNRNLLIDNSIFFPPYTRFQDPPFFVKAMSLAGKFYKIDYYVYKYRILDMDEKYTFKKTIDQLHGVVENLNFSRFNNLPKLHYITAIRLNSECGYMVSRNLESEGIKELIKVLIDANSSVDDIWLKNHNLPIDSPYLVDLFTYLVETTNKYERIRKNKILKYLKKIARLIF